MLVPATHAAMIEAYPTPLMSAPSPSVIEIHAGLVLKGQLSMIKDVVLTGKFEGDLVTHGCLTVASGGVATGTIDVGALVLEPGNLVVARVKVGVKTLPKPGPEPKKSGASMWSNPFQKLKEMALGRK
jgi:hypothetical protein